MPIFSDLGEFELGSVFLGATLGIALQDEGLGLTESIENIQTAFESENISLTESLRIIITHETETATLADEVSQIAIGQFETSTMGDSQASTYGSQPAEGMVLSEAQRTNYHALEAETATLLELHQYLNIGYAGVLGRVVFPVDITNADFCNSVLEAGHGIYINGVAARGFLFPEQKIQKFNEEKGTFPGDAILFVCPTTTIVIGDTILHDNVTYTTITFKDIMIGGNTIAIKWFLRRVIPMTEIPKPSGLVASPNLEGKTTLTWEPINEKFYRHLDKFFVLRRTGTMGTRWYDVIDIQNTPPTTPANGDRYIVGLIPTGAWVEQSGKGATWNSGTLTWDLTTFSDGYIVYVVAKKYYVVYTGILTYTEVLWEVVEKTASNSFTDKNIIANSPYTYAIRVLDLYGNASAFSDYITTPTDIVPPAPPSGVR